MVVVEVLKMLVVEKVVVAEIKWWMRFLFFLLNELIAKMVTKGILVNSQSTNGFLKLCYHGRS